MFFKESNRNGFQHSGRLWMVGSANDCLLLIMKKIKIIILDMLCHVTLISPDLTKNG